MRKAAKISPTELWELFQKKTLEIIKEHYGEDEFEHIDHWILLNTDKIGDDLKKVDFDFENWTYHHYDEYGQFEGMLGYRYLYPLSYIGMVAGGDWEYPIYFIIYLDQDKKTLRGYIPKEGNVWNYDTKRAIGNDEEKDSIFLLKQRPTTEVKLILPVEDSDILFDKNLIRRDIRNRIQVVN